MSNPDGTASGRRRLISAGLAGLVAPWGAARAQGALNKPIRFVVSQAPGATTDATARAFAEHFSQKLGVPVSVDNRPGAGGMIAAQIVANAPPDGTTFLVCLHTQLAQAPVLLKKPPINPDTDLMPISALTPGVLLGMVRTDLAARTPQELVQLSRQRPVTVGNYSIGSGWQMQIAQLIKETGGQFTLLNYKGTSQVLTDLAAKQIDVGAGSLLGATPFLQKNVVRPLVIFSESRSPKLPGIPTWVEAGFTSPAFKSLLEYNMLLAPAGTSADVIHRMAELSVDADAHAPRIRALKDMTGSEAPVLIGENLRKMIDEVWPTYRTLTRGLGLSQD